MPCQFDEYTDNSSWVTSERVKGKSSLKTLVLETLLEHFSVKQDEERLLLVLELGSLQDIKHTDKLSLSPCREMAKL